MKKAVLFLTMLLAFICIDKYKAQGSNTLELTPISPGGYFDKVFDKDGREYSLSDLQVRLDYSHNTTFVSSTTSCTAGFFNVYFANGSGMESTTITAHNDRRALVCHILQNVSGLLGGWATWPSSVHVNILVDNMVNLGVPTPSASGALGLATSFYAIPSNPSNPNPGIAENMLEKTIKSKQDAWTNLISPVISTGGASFYHGAMAFNFANPSYTWCTTYSTSLAPFNQYDLYTVILHEITHALGFASLISSSGISRFGPNYNYYSQYDKFLYDKNNNHLLTSSGCSSQYGLSFTSNTLNLAPGCTSVSPSNSTNCSNACYYASPNLTFMPVYTPECYAVGSSLSHFEDMCYPNNNPANNDLYFTMSNANGQGTNKRYLKPEERKVFCDLGYTVSTTYTSNAVGVGTYSAGIYTYSYSGSGCTPATIWGQNDGFVNGAYTYTSTGGTININISSGSNYILFNDAASAVTASCVQTVYNNGTVNLSVPGVISFSPNPGYVGPVLLRYIPVDAFNNQGNITYIYGFVFPGNCVPATPCDLVQNGTFESNTGCGAMSLAGSNTVTSSCWIPYSLSPDLFVRGCFSSSVAAANLGSLTYSSTINGSLSPWNSYNGAPNNAIIGLQAVDGSGEFALSESYANFLGTPLINNQAYTLSFWAYEFVGSKLDAALSPTTMQTMNTHSVPLVLSFATSSTYLGSGANNFPNSSINTVKSITLAPFFNVWKPYSVTFTYSPGFNGNWLFMGMDKNLGYNLAASMGFTSNINLNLYYVLLDNISIKPVAQSAQFILPSNNVCTSQGYTDLAQYVSIPGGTFTGTGVTPVTTSTGIQYNFNSPSSLPNGLYTITYSYTDNINCPQTAVQQVSLGTVNTGVNLAYITNTNCVNGTTLSVVSPTAGLNYTWTPGAPNVYSIAVNPSVPTSYSVVAFVNSNCLYTGTAQVIPNAPVFTLTVPGNSVCPGGFVILNAIGTYSTILWSPGNFTTNPITVYPTGSSASYTAVASTSLGCTYTKTITINIPYLPVSATTNTANVCLGNSATLSAIGQGTCSPNCTVWYPGGIYGNPIVVTPTAATLYTAQITNSIGCQAPANVFVNVSTFSISPSSANICAGSIGTLTALGNFTSIVWQPGGYTVNPLVVTAMANTIYTATASFTNGCIATQTFAFGNVVDNNPPGYFINAVYPIVCAGNSETLSISTSSLAVGGFTWLPTGPTNTTIIVTPTSTSSYSALVSNTFNGCNYLVTKTLNVSNACCTGSLPAMANVSAITQTISGSKFVNGNILIPTNGNLTLSGEFLFAPNVKITISPGANLNLRDAHLYACSNNMWQGIVVLDGGTFSSVKQTKDNLVEDAITAIDASSQFTNNLSSVLTIANTTFNKNYIDINIGNYLRTNANYPFNISSCVFTCRNLPFSSTNWPQTGTVSTTASNTADLRYMIPGSLTGLSGPYLTQGFTVTPLKNPYSSQVSQTAIQLVDVGMTYLANSPSYLITIGDGTATANFNVFDAHNKFISASNSNVRSYNNVFQNTQVVSNTPGIGIQASNTYTNINFLNSVLDLIAPINASVNINRFYNCHTGINAVNIATLSAQYAEFKSTQVSSVTASPLNAGQYGVFVSGNRFAYYSITNCKFINLTTGIYAANNTGVINPTSNGQVWGSFVISTNTFALATGTVTGLNFMRDGVVIENILSAKGMPGGVLSVNILTLSPLNGMRVQYNNFNQVYRGVRVSNFTNSVIGKFTANNTITLKQDHLTNTQWGINHTNNYNSVVNSNTVTGFSSSLTNTVSGSYSSMNSNSSSQCNVLVTLPVDMQFAGSNSTIWRRNNMSASSRGLQLSSNGIMGTQGSFAAPSDNVWSGSWPAGIYHTYVLSAPNLSLSTIYTRTLNTYKPLNNGGVPFWGNGTLINGNNAASYTACVPPIKPGKGGDPIKINLAKAIASGTLSYPGFFPTETNEINQILLYRELEEDSLLLSSDATLQSFFSSNQSGNFGALSNINELLNSGNLSAANTALSGFSETSAIQGNYKLYYQLYKIYLDPAVDFNATDLTNLQALAAKCPFVDGPIVYNARSLYTCVTGILGDYNDEFCDQNESALVATGGELGKTTSTKNLIHATTETYQLFPNPATDKLHIKGAEENEELTIEIKDVGNKLLYKSIVKLNQFTTEIKLDLINGVYFVSLINPNNERVTKKLVISK